MWPGQSPNYKRITNQLSLLATIHHYYYKTRQEASGVMRQIPGAEARLDLAERSWCWKAAKSYPNLPAEIKGLSKLSKFKQELNAWVKANIES
jgi:hypothetical protein